MYPNNVMITEVIKETPSTRTFVFDRSFEDAIAGQFVMVWIHGVDEIPMTLSSKRSITVQKVGDATEKLFMLEEGHSLGIRGPYGKGFTLPERNEKIMLIAGGVGAAPLVPLAEYASNAGICTSTILGARNADELLFTDRFASCGELHITTDDGSAHRCGFVTDILDETDTSTYDRIYTCGPEMMMKRILDMLGKETDLEKAEFNLHRYFKCGIGVCGACCMDREGLRVCRDGPVFSGMQLVDSEFGNYMRGPSGNKKQF